MAAGARAESLSDERGIAGTDGTQDRFPFYGAHQAGVTTAQPSAVLYAAFDVLATDRAGLEQLFRTLTARIAFLTQGGKAASADPLMPPPDSGLLGPVIAPDNLTVTVAAGSSLFDERFGLAPHRPMHLMQMPSFRTTRWWPSNATATFCCRFARTRRKPTSTPCATS